MSESNSTMTEQQERLYNELLELTKAEPGIFYFSQLTLENVKYRVFNYRILPRYSKWLVNDSALECRGITFQVDSDNQPVALVSWPFEKFFNLKENPLTMDLDLTNPKEILVKEDGSLMSSMMLPSGKLFLKSKASFTSRESKAANQLIGTQPFQALYDWTKDWSSRGYTVIFEYTSPFNKIVVPYSESKLTILAVRNHSDGSYVDMFSGDVPQAIQKLVVKNLVDDVEDIGTFIQSIKNQTSLEGYVVRLSTGQRIKIKTTWYSHLHRFGTTDSNLSDVDIAKLVLAETIDDVRIAHVDSPEVLKRIDEVTRVVSGMYNDTFNVVNTFYETHKHLDRREYAVKAKKELEGYQMGIVMKLLSGKEVNIADSIHSYLKKMKGVPGISVTA